MQNVLWWLSFTLISIWLQDFFPGVDFLVVGLVVSLQEERPVQSFWLLLAFIILQEGAGTLAFGSSLLWYAMAILLFGIGRWMFQAQNFFFIILLGASLGATHFLLIPMMAYLQEFSVDRTVLFNECLNQALTFPFAWIVVYKLRSKKEPDVISVRT